MSSMKPHKGAVPDGWERVPGLAGWIRPKAKEAKSEGNMDKLADVLANLESVKGKDGDPGPQGEQGDKGEQGPQGERGPAGPQGVQGPKGERGERGAAGPAGKDGKQGKDGKPGQDGKDGADGVGISEVKGYGQDVIFKLSDGKESRFKLPAGGGGTPFGGSSGSGGGGGGTSDHESLTGLQGGTTGQHVHLTQAQYSAATGYFGAPITLSGTPPTLTNFALHLNPGGIAVTLPASPVAGDIYRFLDTDGTTFTINPSGHAIYMGGASYGTSPVTVGGHQADYCEIVFATGAWWVHSQNFLEFMAGSLPWTQVSKTGSGYMDLEFHNNRIYHSANNETIGGTSPGYDVNCVHVLTNATITNIYADLVNLTGSNPIYIHNRSGNTVTVKDAGDLTTVLITLLNDDWVMCQCNPGLPVIAASRMALLHDDAPANGTTYGRKNGAWSAVTGGSGGGDGGFAFKYTFSASTDGTTGMGAGIIQFNNSTPSSATLVYLYEVDGSGVTIDQYIDEVDVGDWLMFSNADKSTFHVFVATSTFTSGPASDAIPMTYKFGTPSGFSGGETIYWQRQPAEFRYKIGRTLALSTFLTLI